MCSGSGSGSGSGGGGSRGGKKGNIARTLKARIASRNTRTSSGGRKSKLSR